MALSRYGIGVQRNYYIPNRPSPSDLIGSLVSWFDSSVGGIWSVAISPDGQIIASGGSDQPIMLWDAGTLNWCVLSRNTQVKFFLSRLAPTESSLQWW
jgi:WD40 repeat protein